MTGVAVTFAAIAAGILALAVLADSAMKARKAWRRIKGELK